MKNLILAFFLLFSVILPKEVFAQKCKAKFSAKINQSTRTVVFTDSSYSKITQYSWSFGDGKFSNVQNPTHVYSKGTFWVTLVVYDSVNRCGDSTGMTINITGTSSGCSANFSFLPDTVTNYKIYFKNLSSKSSGTKYKWSFGDGTSSNDANPAHVYKGNNAKYTVCLYVIDTVSKCTDSMCKIIEPQMPCNSNFSYYPVGDSVVFIAGFRPKKVKWDFGDGKKSFSFDTAFHKYAIGGSYKVCLTIYCSKVDSSVTCRNINSCSVRSDYKTNLVSKNTIEFTNLSTGTYLKYNWSFGDGSFSKAKNPTHAYSKSGYYIVKLSVLDTINKCGESLERYVLVDSSAIKCDASFDIMTSNTYLGYYFSANVTKTGTGINHQWTIDGVKQSSKAPKIAYTFSKPGSYVICHKYTDSLNKCIDSICKTFKVVPNCNSGFSIDAKDTNLYYYSAKNTSVIKRKWDFGDGKTSTSDSGVHSYAKSGTYKVCLTVYCKYDTNTSCKNITVKNSGCRAFFTLALDTSQKYKLFLINKSSSSSSSTYYWSFGDGSSSNSKNPSHKYSSFGKFAICLTVSDSSTRCSSSFCDTVGLDSLGKLLKAGTWELVVIDNTSVVDIKKVSRSDIKLYPNPAGQNIFIELNKSIVPFDKIEILNSNGLVCITRAVEIVNDRVEVDVNGLRSGLYLIKLMNNQGYIYTKMMKN